MKTISAGLLLYRRNPHLQVYIGHMGGPFWEGKDNQAWSIPKGLVTEGEDLLAGSGALCARPGSGPASARVALRELHVASGQN